MTSAGIPYPVTQGMTTRSMTQAVPSIRESVAWIDDNIPEPVYGIPIHLRTQTPEHLQSKYLQYNDKPLPNYRAIEDSSKLGDAVRSAQYIISTSDALYVGIIYRGIAYVCGWGDSYPTELSLDLDKRLVVFGWTRKRAVNVEVTPNTRRLLRSYDKRFADVTIDMIMYYFAITGLIIHA